MNLKKFFIFCEILVPTPCSFQMLWTSYDSWNGLLFRQEIWLTYSSNTSQNYLRYKIEVKILEFLVQIFHIFLWTVYMNPWNSKWHLSVYNIDGAYA